MQRGRGGTPAMRRSEPQYAAALAIARTLRDAGHQAFFAGGCVRDLLLGVAPKDYDVATSTVPDQIVELFPKTFTVGAHFGVVLVCAEIDGVEIATEVATFRSDGAYSDGRRPDAVRYTTDPREDVLRRDFTINGMLLDPIAYEATGDLDAAVLDYVGGRKDLALGVVRAIGDPKLRYAEDKLRLLRAVRFAARLNFHLEVEGIRCKAAEITQVSAERTRDELTKILTEGGAARGFEMLYQLGLLARILPEVVRMRGVAQPPEFHPEGDVWVHTMLLLEKLQPSETAPSSSREASKTARSASPTLAWGALLHDVGKPATYQPPNPKIPGDRIRFNGHVEVGVRIAEEILARLRFSNDDTEQIVALVKNHMRFGDILQMKQSTLKRFLRLPRFDEHLELHRLDASSAHGDLTLYDFARAQYEAEPAPDLRPAPLLTGDDLIAIGYKPSPQFKPMLALAEDAQLEGSITTREKALELVQAAYPLAAAGARR
jgi:poly(A) polymerase